MWMRDSFPSQHTYPLLLPFLAAQLRQSPSAAALRLVQPLACQQQQQGHKRAAKTQQTTVSRHLLPPLVVVLVLVLACVACCVGSLRWCLAAGGRAAPLLAWSTQVREAVWRRLLCLQGAAVLAHNAAPFVHLTGLATLTTAALRN
jgi:hypothetical protein